MSQQIKIVIEDCRIATVTVDKNEIDYAGVSDDSLKYSSTEWRVTIKMKGDDGSITVRGQGPHNHLYRWMPLKDGTLELNASQAKAISFTARRIPNMLLERFGITTYKKINPNQYFMSDWCSTKNPFTQNDLVSLTTYLTDGDINGFCINNHLMADECPDATITGSGLNEAAIEWCESERHNFDGMNLACKVSNATWTVMCTYYKTECGPVRESILYTLVPNVYILAAELDRFLDEARLGRFEDYLENFSGMMV